MNNRSVFGKMKVEEVETWLSENRTKMSNQEVAYVENVIYRKRYNTKKWVAAKSLKEKIESRFIG